MPHRIWPMTDFQPRTADSGVAAEHHLRGRTWSRRDFHTDSLGRTLLHPPVEAQLLSSQIPWRGICVEVYGEALRENNLLPSGRRSLGDCVGISWGFPREVIAVIGPTFFSVVVSKPGIATTH